MHGLQMRSIIKNLSSITFYLVIVLASNVTSAEIYRWVDHQGRIQYSDSPGPDYHSQALAVTDEHAKKTVDVKSLQNKAEQLKQERLSREKEAGKRLKAKRKKRLRYEKKLAKAKKRKKECLIARKKEDLAFRQRSKSRSLTAMRKALERYEKKRMIRVRRCQ